MCKEATDIKPLSPTSDKNGISLYIIRTGSNVQVMRTNESDHQR